ncbi:MAG: protein phosphatase 2C domain-containing protein [Polyangiales bacterium]
MGASHRVHARTGTGRVREHNEDCFYVDASRGLYVVADGMGGRAAGEVASSLAVQTLVEAVGEVGAVLDAFLERGEADDAERVREALSAAVVRANGAVFQAAQGEPAQRGMGTTLTALLLLGRRAFIAHVGDSRVYLARNGELRQLTEDHTVVGELRRRGRLRPEVLAAVSNRNAVTRALGVFENVEVDSAQVLAAPGDRFLICTDGLHRYLGGDATLAPMLADVSEEACAHRLMEFAMERGGADNVTVVVVTLPDEGARAQVLRELARSYETLSSLPFFRHLSARELMVLQAMSQVRDCGLGEEVVREGDEGASMFVLLQGACSVRKGDVEIARLGPGEHFGEMALVERGCRTATVVVDDDARLLELARDDLFRLLREEKDAGMKLLWNIVTVLTSRLRETSRELSEAREALVAEDLTAHLFHEDLPAITEEQARALSLAPFGRGDED